MSGLTVIVGAGRMGTTLARDLAQAGQPVWLVARQPQRAAQLADWFAGQGLQVGLSPGLPTGAVELVLAAVPDRALGDAAADMAASASCQGAIRLHLSGVAAALSLRHGGPGQGACGSLHPLAAVADPVHVPTAASPLRGALMALGGDPLAVARADRLARDLGGRPIALDDAARPAWHAAAALIANDWVALALAAEAVAGSAGLNGPDLRSGLLHLARTALDALERVPPQESLVVGLTGAVSRGDRQTLARHLQALAHDPAAQALHRQASLVLVQACAQAGRLSPAVVAELTDLLAGTG